MAGPVNRDTKTQKSLAPPRAGLADINITPLVDVILVLLIIFMITAPVLQSGIDVSLPKTRQVEEITEEKLVVTIDRAQRVYLGNEPVNIHQLGPRIKAGARGGVQQSIFLRCDQTVPFGSFATVMDEIRQAGIVNISVVTEPLVPKKM
jgi:biopolymer transport protein ExbD/biopolymer transport protein TolR